VGAFFLHRTEAPEIGERARTVFTEAGFGGLRSLEGHGWTLIYAPKQLLPDSPNIAGRGGVTVVSVGTAIYGRRAPRASLDAILVDRAAGRWDRSEMRGNFVLVFLGDEGIEIVIDELGVGSVFVTTDGQVASSSFLAVLRACPEGLRPNRLAVLEKLATGYVVAPDTLAEGVVRLTPQAKSWPEMKSVRVYAWPAPSPQEPIRGGERPEDQIAGWVDDYFGRVAATAAEFGVDLGLSSGYDSRMLALAARRGGLPFSVHSHLTQGVHAAEVERVRALANQLRVDLRVVPTARIEDADALEIEAALRDGLWHFDGRSADNSGAYSMTYTRAYKAATLGSARLRLNGEGGEILRNYYGTSLRSVHFPAWMVHHLFYPTARRAIGSNAVFAELVSYVLRKLEQRLGVSLRGRVPTWVTRRYYGEVRLPDCEGVLANADGRLAHFLIPFAEPSLQRMACGWVREVGYGGHLQAAAISSLDARAAALPSHHGYALDEEPLAHRVRGWLKAELPVGWWETRRQMRLRRSSFGLSTLRAFELARARTPLLREATSALQSVLPDFSLDEAARNPPAKATAVFVGVLFATFPSVFRSVARGRD
jgi:hypothetical protein